MEGILIVTVKVTHVEWCKKMILNQQVDTLPCWKQHLVDLIAQVLSRLLTTTKTNSQKLSSEPQITLQFVRNLFIHTIVYEHWILTKWTSIVLQIVYMCVCWWPYYGQHTMVRQKERIHKFCSIVQVSNLKWPIIFLFLFVCLHSYFLLSIINWRCSIGWDHLSLQSPSICWFARIWFFFLFFFFWFQLIAYHLIHYHRKTSALSQSSSVHFVKLCVCVLANANSQSS